MSNKCDLCNLCGFSNPSCIWGTGPKKADIMIINASAGDKDEESGEATMEGIVRRTLENCDYDLDKVYYTNAIKCRTPKGYKIKVSEIKKCRDYLQEEIKKVKPKYVLLLGAQACQAALDMKMSELQGTPYKKDGITYYSTYSPRVLYYDAAKAPQVERELKSFLELTKGNKVNKKGKLNTILLTSLEEVKEAFKDYKKKYKSISYDIESTGLDRFEDDITLFGFGNNKVQYQIPLMVKYSPLEFKPIARKVIMQYAIKQIQTFRWQIAANGKFDDLFLEYHYGLKPFCNFDTNMASHLLDENTPDGLKDSAIRELGAPNWDINTTMKKGTVETKEQLKEFCKYNGYDIYYTHKLFLHYKKLLENDPALYKLQHYLMCPAGRAYERIEKKGIYINPKAYNKSKTELYAERDRIEKELHDLIPDKKLRKKYKDINWNSVDQVSNLLFKDMGMTPLDRTPTGKPQINESVLKRLNHPICDKLIEHRGVATAIGTFVDGWGKLIKEDGRVHTKFNLIGTVTGRTSSNSPNLQQLPRDTSIRCWVDAPEGYTFVTADYSQLELRMAAVVSGDRRMTQLFFEGADIHMNTAMSITGKQPEDIEKEERKKAKSCNFGFLYGMQWKKFMIYARDNYGTVVNEKEAKAFRNSFFDEYSDLLPWHDKQRRLARAEGEVRNPIGRIRHLPGIYSLEKSKQAEAERQAINSPVQGFGSDVAISAIVELVNTVPEEIGYLVGSVHDSIECLVKTEYVEWFSKYVLKTMSNPRILKEIFQFETKVPIIADLEVGPFGLGVELEEWMKTNKIPQKEGWLIDWNPKNVLPPRYKKKK